MPSSSHSSIRLPIHEAWLALCVLTEGDDAETSALKAKLAAINKKKTDPGFSATARVTQLEVLAGKKKNAGLTVEEQVGACIYVRCM